MYSRGLFSLSLLIVILLVAQPRINYSDGVPHGEGAVPQLLTSYSNNMNYNETAVVDKKPGIATSGFWNGTHGTGALLSKITNVARGAGGPWWCAPRLVFFGWSIRRNQLHDAHRGSAKLWKLLGFSAVGAMEIKYKIQMGHTVDLSEQNDLSCAGCDPSEWSGKDCTGQGGCVGNYLSDSLNFLKNSGTPDAACDPYTATASTCGTGRCSDYLSRTYKITGWTYIARTRLQSKPNWLLGTPLSFG